MEDKFEEHAVEFKNESDVEEELDEEGLKMDEIEKDHFEEDEE